MDIDKMKITELREFADKLVATNLALQQELQKAQDKLNHLEQITKFNASPISVASNEEELCKLEINRLYTAAKSAPLEFNEIKAFEIYVKSLMLIRGKTPEDVKKQEKKKEAPKLEQLLQAALQVADEPTEQ
jgi:hypothetical protein